MWISNESLFFSLLIMSILDHTCSEPAHKTSLHRCGGRLTNPTGVIQTPNFPHAFQVPIKCRWIIESGIDNGTISIFFTQQYITSGLTFTEYMFYDEASYKTGERLALAVTEDNITRINKLQVTSPVLVIDLNLNRLEGTQLRALGLLSMFGFNITYAIGDHKDTPNTSICSSAMECRLLGHCYATYDFKGFFCSCFEGYSGSDCGVGHLCSQARNMCKNGGTCGQVGQVAVSCSCPPGYTGELCEAEIHPVCGVEECSEGCTEGTNCDCNARDNDASLVRYEVQLTLDDQPDTNNTQELIIQLKKFLRELNIHIEDEIYVLNISEAETKGAHVVKLRLWASRRDGAELRGALERASGARALGRLRLLPAPPLLDLQPGLNLHSLVHNTNQRSEIWEGSHFMLSCVAYGSSNMKFTWYKDGVKINFNGSTRDIWIRTVAEDSLGRQISVLGVSEATKLDSGKWSCSVVDAGRKRCRAVRLSVLKPPEIRLEATALTVNKGDNISITCLALVGRAYGSLGFSWTKDKALLRLAPGKEVWEDLYPAGSVLKLYNLQKSAEYRCQVSSIAGTNAKSVFVWALGDGDEACPAEQSEGIRWPLTAAGSHAIVVCPPGQNGIVARFCDPKTSLHEVGWMLPNFSGCVAESLNNIYQQFTLLKYGFSWGNVSDLLRQYLEVLRSLTQHPGQGVMPLEHCRNMLGYLLSKAGKPEDRQNSVDYLLQIFNNLLKYPDSFMDEESIFHLQYAVAFSASMRYDTETILDEFTVATRTIENENNTYHMKFKPKLVNVEEWVLGSVEIELEKRMIASTGVAISYQRLTERLPSLRSSLQFIDDSSTKIERKNQEVEYLIASHQVQTFVNGLKNSKDYPLITLHFTHIKNDSAVGAKLACGLRTLPESFTWNLKACDIEVQEPSHIVCKCRGLGTYAVFAAAGTTLTEEERDLRGVVKIIVGLSGAICLVAAALQLLALATSNSKLPIILKAATAGAHSAAMLSLLECDISQEEACPGALGWVCAACWCIGCAVLCAQPLLLQAELAGRSPRASAVGLVAGVSILAWLTARLWGGSPLHLGAAAQIACAIGCVLLTIICFNLTIYIKMSLKKIAHKGLADRKYYIKMRNRSVNNTLLLLLTTSAMQVTGIAYAQPGSRKIALVSSVSAAALGNALAMLICYAIRDDYCLQGARRIMSLSTKNDWHHPVARDTSLNVYIKQGQEAENRGSLFESLSSPASPAITYWRTPVLSSGLHRRQTNLESRADLMRCVEHLPSVSSPRYEARAAVCDLVSQAPLVERDTCACLMLPALNHPILADKHTPLLTYPIPYEPYPAEPCNFCSQSYPDLSIIPPIKSCLKKLQPKLTTTSLPSLEDIKDESATKSDMEQVNREWNKAYSSANSGKVLNQISNDLDFLLNRTTDEKVTNPEAASS